MARLILNLFLLYLAVAAVMFIWQRDFQYAPSVITPGEPAKYGVPEMQTLSVRTDDGIDLLAWFAPPRESDGKIIVLYHGNAGHIGDRAKKARTFIDRGYGVYRAEYRGYAANHGMPTEEGFYKDAESALAWLVENGYPPSQWVLYGESIGSGPAVEMATRHDVAALVLEGAFSSAVDVAQERYFWLPVHILMKDRYDNVKKIKSVKAPLLMVHGSHDTVVPIELGEQLFNAAKGSKKFLPIRGAGHSDLYEFDTGALIMSWLSTLGQENP